MIPFLVIMAWVVPMIVGYAIGAESKRGGEGVLYTFILGWIGVVIIAVIVNQQKHAHPLPPPAPRARPSQFLWSNKVIYGPSGEATPQGDVKEAS